ncbi:hypothetical protein BC629DRAFT_1474546 [Irpex lacteus]|nr:hypothetical protein BC629DRAFT_1474546 [Irpex lacteus]
MVRFLGCGVVVATSLRSSRILSFFGDALSGYCAHSLSRSHSLLKLCLYFVFNVTTFCDLL